MEAPDTKIVSENPEALKENPTLIKAILKLSGEESILLKEFYKFRSEKLNYEVDAVDRKDIADKAIEVARELQRMGYDASALNATVIENYLPEEEL